MNRASSRFLLVTLIAAGGFWLAASLLAKKFPPPNTDEVFIVAHGTAFWHGQGCRYSLYDDVFAPSVYAMRDAFGQILQTATNAWYGAWPARPASAFAAMLGLLMMTACGTRLGGRRLGSGVFVIMLLNPLVWCAACLIRPEALLLLGSAGVLYLVYRLPDHWQWSPFLIGALSGGLLAIHPNALVIAPGILAVYVAKKPSLRRLIASISAALAAGLAVALIPGLPNLFLVNKSLAAQLLRPFITQFPWTLHALAQAIQGKLVMTQTLFLPNGAQAAWQTLLRLRMIAAVILFGMMAILWQKNSPPYRERLRPLLWGLSVTWCGMVLCVANREVLYQLHLEPFTVLLFASVWMEPALKASRLWSLAKLSVAVLWVGSIFIFASLTARTMAETPSIQELTAALRNKMPTPQAKILAPNIFWREQASDQFRDIGALNYSYFYTGGQRDLKAWISPWRPDVLVVDEATRRVLLRGRPALTALQELLAPVHVLDKGTLDTRLPTVGKVDIFWLDWPHVGR